MVLLSIWRLVLGNAVCLEVFLNSRLNPYGELKIFVYDSPVTNSYSVSVLHTLELFDVEGVEWHRSFS